MSVYLQPLLRNGP